MCAWREVWSAHPHALSADWLALASVTRVLVSTHDIVTLGYWVCRMQKNESEEGKNECGRTHGEGEKDREVS